MFLCSKFFNSPSLDFRFAPVDVYITHKTEILLSSYFLIFQRIFWDFKTRLNHFGGMCLCCFAVFDDLKFKDY